MYIQCIYHVLRLGLGLTYAKNDKMGLLNVFVLQYTISVHYITNYCFQVVHGGYCTLQILE